MEFRRSPHEISDRQIPWKANWSGTKPVSKAVRSLGSEDQDLHLPHFGE